MNGKYGVTGPAGSEGSYFFLSYAHSSPLEGRLQAEPDRWVSKFFGDLTDAVRRRSPPEARLTPGFYDQDIPLSSDWKDTINQALSTAKVFVPLYSPGYFARSWPGREWAAFRERLRVVGLADRESERRFAPVLWIPLPRSLNPDPAGLRKALAVGASESAYAMNGLRALLRLTPYRASYRLVVDRLAAKIVELAETAPLPASPEADIERARSPFKTPEAVAVFTVTVAAPARGDVQPGQDVARYGDRGVDWQPYPGDQLLSLADYAAWVAEQLDFSVTIDGIEAAAPGSASPSGGDRARSHSDPGVVLIDPWLVASDDGADALRSFVNDLPSWVMPLLVLHPDDQREEPLAARARGIVGNSTARTELARRAMKGVGSLRDFVSLMPALITEAERQYLRRKPVLDSMARPGSRPTLTAGRPPASPIPPHSVKEQPDV